jgi:hydroxyacylglutathione hydrolase
MQVVMFNVGPMDNNTYLVFDQKAGEAVVIDPAYESRFVLDEAKSRNLRIIAVLNTHCHFDHVVENAFFVEQTGAPLAMHADEVPVYEALDVQAQWFGVPAPKATEVTRRLANAERVAIGGGDLQVLHTPGHSPGGICFVGDTLVIVGDTLFAGSIGRADLPGGDYHTLIRSIRERLFALPDDFTVYPGHGPETTIGHERRTNPFL